jgi:hypothetical protein
LKKQKHCDEDKKHLIFLTPTGHEAESGKAGTYQQLSYCELAEAFIKLLDGQHIPQPSVREILKQYIVICRLIGGEDMTNKDEEMQKLIKNLDNLETALMLEQQTALARREIGKQFAENIESNIQSRILADHDICGTWHVGMQKTGKGLDVWIRTKRHRDNKPNYSLDAEGVVSEPGAGTSRDNGTTGYVCWSRPNWVDIKKTPVETVQLTEKMMQSGYAEAGGWRVAWNYLRNGKKGYIFSNNNDIVACAKDNLDPKHPLAVEIADEMWKMFTTYRADVEALEGFKKTAL